MVEQVLVSAWEWRASVLLPLAFTSGVLLLGMDNEYMLGLFSSINSGFMYCLGKSLDFGGGEIL